MSHQRGNNDARRSNGMLVLGTEMHLIYRLPATWTTSPCNGLIEIEKQGGKESSRENPCH